MSLGIITNVFKQEFKSNLELLSQQMGSRFVSAVTNETISGKKSRVLNQIAARVAQLKTSRHQDLNAVDSQYDARWITPKTYFDGEFIDNDDILRSVVDPSSAVAKSLALGMERKKDQIINDAFWANADTGEDGSTSTAFLSTQVVAVTVGGGGSATGLNLAKLIEARKILEANNVDLEREAVYCGINAKQHADLLQVTQAVSLDFRDKPVLENGRIKHFMGINFIPYQDLSSDGTYTRIPLWVPSGMAFGALKGIESDIVEKDDSINTKILKVWMDCGATRLDEKKVVEIKSVAS